MLSPRTQALTQQQGMESQEDLFIQGFQELALSNLSARHPEIANSVLTFKMIKSSPENGTATGTAIIDHAGVELHVPVVLANNELQPFDMVYIPKDDAIVPLTPGWLSEVASADVHQMGRAVKAPKGLASDVDIRHVMIPPSTGRYSYASDRSAPLMSFLEHSPDRVKKAFFMTLQNHPKIAHYMIEREGIPRIKKALEYAPKLRAKTAADTKTHAQVFTMKTPVETLKRELREYTPDVMASISQAGYAYKDNRPADDLNVVTRIEHELRLEDPSAPGFYDVFTHDGKARAALIFTKVYSTRTGWAAKSSRPLHAYSNRRHESDVPRIVLLEDGTLFFTQDPFMARHKKQGGVPPKFRKMIETRDARTPRNGQRGFFCSTTSDVFSCLEPVKITKVLRTDKGITAEAITYSGDTISIVKPNAEHNAYKRPRVFSTQESTYDGGTDVHMSWEFRTKAEQDQPYSRDIRYVVVIPAHYEFVAVERYGESNKLLKTPEAVTALHVNMAAATGGVPIRIKNAHASCVHIDGENYTRFAAIEKVANAYDIHVSAADELVSAVMRGERVNAFALTHRQKVAMDEEMATGEEMPMEEMPMEPAPPSSTEIAAQEIQQHLEQAYGEVRQQLMTNEDRLALQLRTVSAVVQRAAQLDAEAAGMMDPSMMDPSMMDPSMMDPSMMDPSMMDPSMMDPSMMDPSMMDPSQAVEEPQTMEMAMGLEDPEMFDATALSSLADSNNLYGHVAQYTPLFQETLDKLGKTLLEMRMDAAALVERMGAAKYHEVTSNLSALFDQLGETLLNVTRSTHDIQGAHMDTPTTGMYA